MTDRESKQAGHRGAAPGRDRAARSQPAKQASVPSQNLAQDALGAGNYAGFATRRVPPVPDIEPVDPPDPAAHAQPVSGGLDPSRQLTRIRSDRTAPLPPDPKSPVGPNPDRASALVQARVEQRDKRRASRGRSRKDGAIGHSYVKTASIQADLIRRGKGLFARYRRESGLQIREDNVDPRDFVVWLFSLKPQLASSSWRIYRASTLAFVQTVPHAGFEEAVAMLDANIGIGADAGQARPRGRRGGVARSELAKRFDYSDFEAVLHAVGKLSRSEAVPWLTDWLSAGINTGLRPSEWAATILEVRSEPDRRHGRGVWLHVLNAKDSAARANASQRIIDISDFTDGVFDAVRRHVEWATVWSLAQQFEMRHSQCAQLLYKTCSVLFPRQRQRYSLFSLRHQFIANMKTIYRPAEVAALVGHISKDEAVEHYGKRRAAWLPEEIRDMPAPMPGEVKRMHRQWELYEGRREVKKLREALLDRRREVKAMAKKPKPER
jgi:hypothetical protein